MDLLSSPQAGKHGQEQATARAHLAYVSSWQRLFDAWLHFVKHIGYSVLLRRWLPRADLPACLPFASSHTPFHPLPLLPFPPTTCHCSLPAAPPHGPNLPLAHWPRLPHACLPYQDMGRYQLQTRYHYRPHWPAILTYDAGSH